MPVLLILKIFGLGVLVIISAFLSLSGENLGSGEKKISIKMVLLEFVAVILFKLCMIVVCFYSIKEISETINS